ncbi:MAG: hypothetical protein ACYCO9_08250 [Streptosporangiaceae bacterium]
MGIGPIRRLAGTPVIMAVAAAASAAVLVLTVPPAMAADAAPAGVAARAVPGTIACAGACFSLYSRQLGPGVTMNAFIPGDNGLGGRVGRKINMHPASDYRPNGDFIPTIIGQVFQFCGTSSQDFYSSTSYACTNDGRYWVFEANWAPQGTTSDLCVGVSGTGTAGQSVTLRPCGISRSTLWITDNAHSFGGDCRVPGSFCPWISGTSANFKAPLVLTIDASTRSPVDQLKIESESLLGDGHAVSTQEFAFYWGSVR